MFRLCAYVFLIAVIALGFTSTKASTVTSEERTENQHGLNLEEKLTPSVAK